MDFSISRYKELLKALKNQGYLFQTFEEFVRSPQNKVVILRHDVDKLPQNSLNFARIQHSMEVKGTYYFRIVNQSFDEEIIREIFSLGHEIGYHYENMDSCNGNVKKAYEEFCKNLKKYEELVPVSTISMHGSPMSKFDNRDIWKTYSYKHIGIFAEPYFDLDFSNVLYLTDTGRRWDGDKFSIRDRSADSSINKHMNIGNMPKSYNYKFRHTQDIIEACEQDLLPNKVMMNFHPQRWTDNPVLWTRELVAQNVKNVAKVLLRAVRE